jgi:uncharacterized protein YndB with AHSA1/START domain
MIEVSHQISDVQRGLGTRTLAAGEARTLTISQRYRTGIDDLWDACTNPERIPRWFVPVTGELSLGGRYQIEGNASGTVERCDPPKSFAATWEFGGQVSWIEVGLTAEPDGWTRLELQHIAHVNDDMWDQFGPGAVGIGWDMIFMGLASHLAGHPLPAAQDRAAWPASEDGKLFTSLSSERWREASVAAGTDEAAAKAAADRCLAAYTGGPAA